MGITCKQLYDSIAREIWGANNEAKIDKTGKPDEDLWLMLKREGRPEMILPS
jgi:hypothetical protein